MLLAKFIEGFIFGIKKTKRLDENPGEELLILADKVSTGIKEVEDQLDDDFEEELLMMADQVSTGIEEEDVNQAAVVEEEDGRDADAEPETSSGVGGDGTGANSLENNGTEVVGEPENSLDKETIKEVDDSVEEETRWWLAFKEEEENSETAEEEGSRKDLLDLANNFYQKAHQKEKIKTAEYVPFDPTVFMDGEEKTTINDELINNTIDETERMDGDQIVNKVKISMKEFNKEIDDDMNKGTGFNNEIDDNLILVNANKGTGFNKEIDNLGLVSSDNKGEGFFEEVDLAPTIVIVDVGGKEEKFEKENDENAKSEGVGLFDKVDVVVEVKPVGTKMEFENDKEMNDQLKEVTTENVVQLVIDKEEIDKTESQLEDQMLTDWFQKMEDALNGVGR